MRPRPKKHVGRSLSKRVGLLERQMGTVLRISKSIEAKRVSVAELTQKVDQCIELIAALTAASMKTNAQAMTAAERFGRLEQDVKAMLKVSEALVERVREGVK